MKQKKEHDDMLELRRKFTPTKHNSSRIHGIIFEKDCIKTFLTLSNRDDNKIKYIDAILLDAHNKSELKIPIAEAREVILANYNQFEILNNPISDELSDDVDYFN